MFSAVSNLARISSASFLYTRGVRISHIVSPARKEAVVSDPATLSSQKGPIPISEGYLHEESAVEYDLILGNRPLLALAQNVIQEVTVLAPQALVEPSVD